VVEDRVIGVLHVGSLRPRSFTDVETGLLERAADRIALTVDRTRQHTVAELLQRTLLPARLPEVPGLEIAARYRPGADDAHVGGDWYDVVLLPHGRVGVAIGDVVSRGVRAAAVMGQMRIGLRAYALEGDGPGPVLDRLDRLVRGLDEREMATVAYLVLDQAEPCLTMAVAGHLPPLLISASGETRLLDELRSRPIGVAAARRYEEATVELARGDTLVLYTDGLVERRGESIDEGVAVLAEAARDAVDRSVDELCDRLLAATDGWAAVDDVALLAIRVPAEASTTLALRLAAEPDSLATMRRAINDWLRGLGVDEADGYDVLVAVGEAAANAIEHAYGPSEAEFRIEARHEEHDVVVTVSDEGDWRPARGSHRGRGLAMMKKLMDDVQVNSDADGTAVTMRKRMRSPE
jgi:serine phosphatase RsbU (regulator of sigma subunit)/anti-sigma regulatory factor (Ser/Thr protein kinase)